jgi:hypothetical protein
MTSEQQVDALIQQAAELPDEAQAELVKALVEMRSQHLGTDAFEDIETTSR